MEQYLAVIFQLCTAAIDKSVKADFPEERVNIHGSASGVDEGGVAFFAGSPNGTDCGFRQVAVLGDNGAVNVKENEIFHKLAHFIGFYQMFLNRLTISSADIAQS